MMVRRKSLSIGQDSQEGEAAEDDDSDESGPLEANPKV